MKGLSIAIRHKLLVSTALALLLWLFIALPVWAIESRSGERVTVSKDEVIDSDLYVSGSTIAIDGTVRGDVIGMGRQIIINGTVAGDLLAAGQSIVINGTVNDDVRIAGQVLQLGSNAKISDDVVAAASSWESQPGSSIGGDLSYMGGQALLAGTVQQNLKVVAAGLEIRGTVGRDANVTVGEHNDTANPPFTGSASIPRVAGGLTLNESARIGSRLNYKSASEARINPSAQIAGGVNREAIAREGSSLAVLVWGNVQRWITLLLVGSLLLWLLPGWLQRLTGAIASKPLPSLGWGIVMLAVVGALAIAIPIVTIFLTAIFGSFLWNLAPLILGVGFFANLALIVGFFLFVGYVPAIALSSIAGQRLLHPDRGRISQKIAPLAVGLLIFVILTAIPLLGGAIYLVTMLLGLGALWTGRGKRPAHPVSEPLVIAR